MLGYSPRWRKPLLAARPPARRGNLGFLIVIIVVSNVVTHSVLHVQSRWKQWANGESGTLAGASSLYLINEASRYVHDVQRFEQGVRSIASKLAVPPEWLMAVMFAESRFDASAANAKGSGAMGLIQFMPVTATELGVSTDAIRTMDPVSQLDLVYRYLRNVQRARGEFQSLTDLYLGILYPKAVGADPCFTLYGCNSVAYRQNAGLDENRDGQVTVSDIDRRMLRMFPDAYVLQRP